MSKEDKPSAHPKKEHQKKVNTVRYDLVQLQQQIRTSALPVIILLEGIDGAGKHEISDDLNEWMDPRWLKTKAYDKPNEEESSRPEFWRFWKDLPGNGEMRILLHAWHSEPILDRTEQKNSTDNYDKKIKKINQFEKTLRDNGVLVLKFFINLDHQKQHERLIKLSSDELLSWKIKASDWDNLKLYDQYIESSKQMLNKNADTPWNLIDGADTKKRSLVVAKIIIEEIKAKLDNIHHGSQKRKTSNERLCPKTTYFKDVDLTQKLEKADYKHKLKSLQAEISKLQQIANRNKISSIIVMEGWDAAGKGGAIRRLARALDSRQYEVTPIAAPTPEELAHHYLWRFWKEIPSAGRVAIFDRSWYGRVLVERIEGFATAEEWKRAYKEIQQFENQIIDSGAIICKFWVHIDQEEQLGRFKDREHTPHKSWKLNNEDWRNRDKWKDYLDAAEDMFELTKEPTPWNLIAGNQKHFSRVKILEVYAEALKNRLSEFL